MFSNILSAMLVAALWLLQKHLPKGTIEIDYFKGELEILQEENIPTF